MPKLFTSLFTFYLLVCGVAVAQPHLVSLHDVPLRPGLPRLDSVLDERPQPAALGQVRLGLMNRHATATFPQALASHLTTYCRGNRPTSANQLWLVVNELSIGEDSWIMRETGYAEGTFSVCRPGAGATLPDVLFTWHGRVSSSGRDVTASHPQRIRQLLENCLTAFVARSQSANGEGLHEGATFAPGFYASWDALRAGKPADTLLSAYTLDQRKHRLTLRHRTDRRRAEQYFAFSDGENLFINARAYTAKHRAGDYFAKADLLGRYVLIRDRHYEPLMGASFSFITPTVDAAFMDARTGEFFPLIDETMTHLILKDFPQWRAQYAQQRRGGYPTRRAIIASINQTYAQPLASYVQP